MLEITELNIYPVKSLQGISLQKAELGVTGLEYDRNWMVVDSNYNFLTQRNLPQMATIETSINQNSLVLEHESITPLELSIDQKSSNQVLTKLWDDQCSAFDEGYKASKWLTEVLYKKNGKDLKLLKIDNNFKRMVDNKYLHGEISYIAFADGFPFLITLEESLNRLNDMLIQKGSQPVDMERFRSNIVIKGTDPLEENNFETLSDIESKYSFGIRKPCQRCIITTFDQKTSKIVEKKEPLRTLIQMNPFHDKQEAYFGQNATLLAGDGEVISVGDKLIFELKGNS